MKIYAVGGIIRDSLLGIPSKDADYVVVGATPEQMVQAGYVPVGNDFPVFLHPKTKEEYALARTERKSGVGYKGFTFQASPEVSLEEDLSRRDLTINAIAQEIDEKGHRVGPLIDPYGGQQDIRQKIFRHVSPAFVEDPLRVLRVARFAARFPEFEIANETLDLLKKIVASDELAFLVPERVWQEISRGLMATRPSRMLLALNACGALKALFPKELLSTNSFDTTIRYLDLVSQKSFSLQQRFAALMALIEFEQAATWYDWLKVPNDCRAYAEIFRIWTHSYSSSSIASDAKSMMVFFDRADAWRKPDRLTELFDLADCLQFSCEKWRHALSALAKVDAGSIAQGMSGAKGESIRDAVHQARLKAVEASL